MLDQMKLTFIKQTIMNYRGYPLRSHSQAHVNYLLFIYLSLIAIIYNGIFDMPVSLNIITLGK